MHALSRFVGKYTIWVYSALAFIFLLIPIVYTIVFSFNDSRRTNIEWRGFTLDNWIYLCEEQGVCEAFANSVFVGIAATVLATTLGTMIAIALVRYRFRFRAAATLYYSCRWRRRKWCLLPGLQPSFWLPVFRSRR